MIAEQLIRSGKAFSEGVPSPVELLQIISDSEDQKAKNFWQHVIIAEVDLISGRVEAQPVQSWGSWHTPEGAKKPVFSPDQRARLAPIFIPSGGNPLTPQGYYGLPIYPVWEKHWQSFAKDAKGVESFLAPRIKKTVGIKPSAEVIGTPCQRVHEIVREYSLDTKPLAVMVLVFGDGIFSLTEEWDPATRIAPSQLEEGKHIHANGELMLERIWEAKTREGAEKGELDHGICAFTGERGPVISGDNKAWPWFTTTWQAPFPESFGDKDYVQGLAFSPETYKNLTIGASLFGKLTRQLDFNLNKQLFAPVDSARGRENASRGQAKTAIHGSVAVTPLLDVVNIEDEDKKFFASGVRKQMEGKRIGAKLLLNNLLGYDAILPEELARDQFRLTSLYFSGDTSRADVHLHATIEDMVPSTLVKVERVKGEIFEWSSRFYTESQEWLRQRTKSLPYLLVMAYGPSQLWRNLSDVLHGDKLPWEPFVRGVAHRCGELAHSLSDNGLALRNEAVLYATFRSFFDMYHQEFGLERREMRPWQELLANISKSPVKEIEFRDAEELGFAAGYLVRRFSRQYYAATDSKDYLQHRVMTFGSDLMPEVIYKRAIGKLPEYSMRVGTRINEDYRQRIGVWLSEYPRMKDKVRRQSDEFMAAFWSGYMLGGIE